MATAPVLSIDYGTTNTVGVVLGADGRPEPLLFDGAPLLPSAVWLDDTGRLLTGRDALHSARLDPPRFEPTPKQRVDEGELWLGSTAVPVVDTIAAVLSRVQAEATRTVGASPATVHMTHPARWGRPRLQILLDAAAKAGLPVPELVPEPVAAAVYFTQVLGSQIRPGGHVVVYDLGAGTLDVAAVVRTADGWRVVDVDGLDTFGGVDVDAMVIDCVAAAIPGPDHAQWGQLIRPRTVQLLRLSRSLWEDARSAKEMLSRQTSAPLFLPLLDRDVHVTRAELERRAWPRFAEAAELTARLIARCHLRSADAHLFLVGGSSRIPLVATTLHQATGLAPTALDRPELVVAVGAITSDATPPAAATPAALDLPTFGQFPDQTTSFSSGGPAHTPASLPVLAPPQEPTPTPMAPGRRRSKWRVAILIASICTVIGLAAGVGAAAYYRGAFADDGPYTSTPDACSLMRGNAYTNYFADGDRSPDTLQDGVESCGIYWKRGDDSRPADGVRAAYLDIHRYRHRGHVDATEIAREGLKKEYSPYRGFNTDSQGNICTPAIGDDLGSTEACAVGNLMVILTVTPVSTGKSDPVQATTDLLKPVLHNLAV